MSALFNSIFDWNSLDSASLHKGNVIQLFRRGVVETQKSLRDLFESGTPVEELVHLRAQITDELLTRAWHLYFSQESQQIALVAVGGYGRAELHPASDIDLLLLIKNNDFTAFKESIEHFLMQLWDMGLEVGHSVRSIKDCVEQSKQDITVATSLMEARLICGPDTLFESLENHIGPDKIWPSKAFYQAKMDEQKARHRRFGETAYNLEPNIKENPGGLRDLQVIGWVAKRHFGATTLYDLIEHGFLTQQEYQLLFQCQNFLWRIRMALHFLLGRKEDRLQFDYQRTLAAQFGYQDDDSHLAVEKFMKEYYRTVMELSRLNEMLLQLFVEEIINKEEKENIKTINKRFQSHNGFLEITHPKVFEYQPFALLELFLVMQQNQDLKGVRAETIRIVRNNRHLINDNFRNDLRCHSLFMEIFRHAVGLTHELRRMNRYGILAAYVPEFANIVGQMQHDLFHVYTVDEHTMFLVRNIRRFTVAEFEHEFPLCSKIIKRVPKQEILYLAGFFHDIAKGRGGNHSELGAEDATKFCRHHGLSQYDSNLVAWLVRNHLIMSVTAQRKDISDPDVIAEFAAIVGSQEKLNYLYLLTVADIRATSPKMWNSWKDSLLAELYHNCSRAFRQGLENPKELDEIIGDCKLQVLNKLRKRKFNTDLVEKFWEMLDDDYFIRHSVDEIAWQARTILPLEKANLPIVAVREETHRGGTEVFVCAQDHNYVFAIVTAVLERLGLTITDARVFTSQNKLSIDTFIVLEKSGDTISDENRSIEIRDALLEILRSSGHNTLQQIQVSQTLPRQLKYFPISTQVNFDFDPHRQYNRVEVKTSDRPGLLALLAKAFLKCKLSIHNAKIATFGERVEDIFLVTDNQGEPVNDQQRLDALRDTIIELLDQ